MSIADKPVHPCQPMDHGYPCGDFETGITLLEHYAGLAMQAICVNAGRNGCSFDLPNGIAKTAIECAKALIAELEKEAMK